MDDFKNRLLEFITQQFSESQRGFERRCGLSQSSIARIGAKGPSVEILQKISNACPELNLNWLISGKGDMLNASGGSAIASGKNSIAAVNSEVSGAFGALEEKVKMLEELLKEKERTIQILLNK